MKYAPVNSLKQKGLPIFEVVSVMDGEKIGVKYEPVDITLEDALRTPWYYVVDTEVRELQDDIMAIVNVMKV